MLHTKITAHQFNKHVKDNAK